jgi:hypothetical protein
MSKYPRLTLSTGSWNGIFQGTPCSKEYQEKLEAIEQNKTEEQKLIEKLEQQFIFVENDISQSVMAIESAQYNMELVNTMIKEYKSKAREK